MRDDDWADDDDRQTAEELLEALEDRAEKLNNIRQDNQDSILSELGQRIRNGE